MSGRPGPVEVIRSVQFCTLTAEQILSFSVAEVTKPASKGGIDRDTTNTPYDERMGALENGKRCLTCYETNVGCPGHFGHIVLPEPIYNRQFFDYTLKILQCVCIVCARPRITYEEAETRGLLNIKGLKRLRAYANACTKVECCPWEDCKIIDNDFTPLSSFDCNKDKEEIRRYFGNRANAVPFTAGEALNVFMRISNDHLRLLGFNEHLDSSIVTDAKLPPNIEHIHQFRPESLIFTVLPVMPPSARHYVIRDGERCDDDLTDKYNSIVKFIIKLNEEDSTTSKRRRAKVSEADRKKYLLELQNHVWTLMDNRAEKSKLSSGGRPHKCLTQRLQGKEGHLQSNVGGKRVDFTARSVIIGGGSMLESDQLGVPKHIAQEITKPEIATSWNIGYLQKLIDEGHANRVIRNERTIRLSEVANKFAIRIGDVVERHLQDNDYVLFNRQPTLRVESMQSFRVKIIDGYSFRLPLAFTTPFNADFDGDEMNLHCPQSVKATIENETLMRSSVHIVTAQRNGPVAGIVQDGLVACYLLTNTWPQEDEFHTMVKSSVAYNCISSSRIPMFRVQDLLSRAKKHYETYIEEHAKGDLRFASEIPGKLLASILFPPNFCYTRRTNTNEFCPEVKIENGVLLPSSGPLCKNTIGSKSGGILHVLWKEYSPEIAQKFITETQFLADFWLPSHGFSMGISDCLATSYEPIHEGIAEMESKVAVLLDDWEREREAGICERTEEDIEMEINNIVNSAMNVGVKIAKTHMNKADRNALNIMRNSGAKGSLINLSQIVAHIGQQNVNGGRIPLTLSNASRALPIFEEGDISPEARGFVRHSFIDGLTPAEVFFHAAGGREGIIATAIRTADTGYMQKRICRKMEDYKIVIDGTVRDSNNHIVQFLYGDDGLDPKKLCSHPSGGTTPVNVRSVALRLNSDAVRSSEIEEGEEPVELEDDEIEFILNYIVCGSPGIQSECTLLATENIREILRGDLRRIKIYEAKIPDLCMELVNAFETSKAQYGDMVGLIAASAIGEPTTQLTLNVFHTAGCKGKDVTLGVPRFNELLNATKKPSRPGCSVYFEDSTYKNIASKRRELEETTIETFLESSELRYLKLEDGSIPPASPLGVAVTFEEYKEEWWVPVSSVLKGEPEFGPCYGDWVVLLHFNIEKLYEKRITLEDIADEIMYNSEGKMCCVASPNCIGRIEVYTRFSDIRDYVIEKLKVTPGEESTRPPLVNEENVNFFVCRNAVMDLIKGLHISGISGISKTYLEKDSEESDTDSASEKWMLETQGSNLLQVLNIEGVDTYRTVSDDMWEIYEIFGIEAARKFLIQEMTRIISFDGTYINPRHIQLLVDSMTCSGEITSVRRDGISREAGPISKIMFERAVDNGIQASVFGEKDHLNTVSSAVMFGLIAPSGTGTVSVVREDKVPVKPEIPAPLILPMNSPRKEQTTKPSKPQVNQVKKAPSQVPALMKKPKTTKKSKMVIAE